MNEDVKRSLPSEKPRIVRAGQDNPVILPLDLSSLTDPVTGKLVHVSARQALTLKRNPLAAKSLQLEYVPSRSTWQPSHGTSRRQPRYLVEYLRDELMQEEVMDALHYRTLYSVTDAMFEQPFPLPERDEVMEGEVYEGHPLTVCMGMDGWRPAELLMSPYGQRLYVALRNLALRPLESPHYAKRKYVDMSPRAAVAGVLQASYAEAAAMMAQAAELEGFGTTPKEWQIARQLRLQTLGETLNQPGQYVPYQPRFGMPWVRSVASVWASGEKGRTISRGVMESALYHHGLVRAAYGDYDKLKARALAVIARYASEYEKLHDTDPPTTLLTALEGLVQKRKDLFIRAVDAFYAHDWQLNFEYSKLPSVVSKKEADVEDAVVTFWTYMLLNDLVDKSPSRNEMKAETLLCLSMVTGVPVTAFLRYALYEQHRSAIKIVNELEVQRLLELLENVQTRDDVGLELLIEEVEQVQAQMVLTNENANRKRLLDVIVKGNPVDAL